MNGQLLQAESFFAAKRLYFLCDSFWQATQKKTTNCHCSLINQIQPRTIFTEKCKKLKTEWADKNNFLCFLIPLFHCQCACYFLFIGLDCYRAGTKLDKSECLKANGQENVPPQYERCTIACKR